MTPKYTHFQTHLIHRERMVVKNKRERQTLQLQLGERKPFKKANKNIK
jgi:hypothetical protein